MTKKSMIYLFRWHPRRRHVLGMTLIEVVAGLAILGSLLTATVFTKVRYKQQWGDSNRRLEAIRAADELLGTWWGDLTSFPRSQRGDVPRYTSLIWRTQVLSQEPLDQWGGQMVRLEIFDRRVSVSAEPLVLVDLVLPMEIDEDE